MPPVLACGVIRRLLVALAALAVLAGAATLVVPWATTTLMRWRAFRLTAALRLEEVPLDLSARFEHAAVVAEAGDDPVRTGSIQPGHIDDADEESRPAIIAPPASRFHFPVDVPMDARLRFAIGVQGKLEIDPDRSGIRFAVDVDGQRRFERILNPASRHRDRQWVTEEIDLAPFSGRTVDVVFSTERENPAAPPAGLPGWSHLRLVRAREVARQPAEPTKPNVLIVLVDTLRADALGCYGAQPSLTPSVDSLARRGLVFEQAISQASWTSPSVASVFTGLYPRSHGVVGERFDGPPMDDGTPGSMFLADPLTTLAETASSGGVTTVAVSGNPLVSRGLNFSQGFETFVEFSWNRTRSDWIPAETIADTFLTWLARNRQHRFLAYLQFMEPHDPYRPKSPPKAPLGVRPVVADGRPARLPNETTGGTDLLPAAEVDYLRLLYRQEVAQWDAAFGKLLDGLAAEGVLDSTFVIFTADHGEEFQEHGRLRHVIHLYDELIHVPLVIAGPGLSPRRVADQAQLIDLFPTVAAMLGVDAPADLPGHHLFRPHPTTVAISETRFGSTPDRVTTPLVSLRTENWKLIWGPSLGHYVLYELATDPGEHQNRYGTAAESETLAKALVDWRASLPRPPATAPMAPGVRDKLRDLGYID
jgi:arylsulfatase A-like enzyme